MTDRRAGTSFSTSTPADYFDLVMPAGTRITALEASGNYLVAAEIRNTANPATDGTYVEVFDARKLRDRIPRSPNRLSGFTLADTVGAIRVHPFASLSGWADLHLVAGRAVVTLAESGYAPNGAPPANGFIVADIRTLMDDDPAGPVNPQTPGTMLQGTLDLRNAKEVAVRGNLAVVATDVGIVLADISQALDENPATTTLTIDQTIALPMAESVALSGSWLVAYARVPGFPGSPGLRAYDLTAYFEVPATGKPTLESFYATGGGAYQCGALDRYEVTRTKVSLAGSRAYATLNLSENLNGGTAPSLVIFELK